MHPRPRLALRDLHQRRSTGRRRNRCTDLDAGQIRFRLDSTDPDGQIEALRRTLHERPSNVCIVELYYLQDELSMAEASERLGCSHNQLKRLIADNELAATQRPRSRFSLIPEASIVEYEARRARIRRELVMRGGDDTDSEPA